MNRHSKAVEAVKTIREYCENAELCGKCVLFPVCSEGYNFSDRQMEDVEEMKRRLEREDARRKVRMA